MIKIGLPKKGRLKDLSINLFKKAGYEFNVPTYALASRCKNDDIEFIFLQAKDIPVLVADGSLALGITGEDLVAERNVILTNVLPLQYGICSLAVAIDEKSHFKSIQDLQGKRIATSFPHITKTYFAKHNLPVKIIEIAGSVEVMIKLGVCDAVVDLVETGDTLRNNNLKLIHTIEQYQCALFCKNDELSKLQKKEISNIKNRLLGIIIAKEYCMIEYNIERDNLKQAEKISQGYYSPTVSPLENENWLAVRVMVKKKESNHIIESLTAVGATGILEFQVTTCRL